MDDERRFEPVKDRLKPIKMYDRKTHNELKLSVIKDLAERLKEKCEFRVYADEEGFIVVESNMEEMAVKHNGVV